MTVCEIKEKKKEVEQEISELLVKLQSDTGLPVTQVNVWETQTQSEEGPVKSLAVQIILKL